MNKVHIPSRRTSGCTLSQGGSLDVPRDESRPDDVSSEHPLHQRTVQLPLHELCQNYDGTPKLQVFVSFNRPNEAMGTLGGRNDALSPEELWFQHRKHPLD